MTHFAAQGDITAERLAVVVDDIGLNAVALTSCLHDARTKAEMEDLGDGYAAGWKDNLLR